MRKLLKKISNPFLKFCFDYYYRKPRKFSYQNITILVHPEVFSPKFTISTKLLLNYIKPLNLNHKNLLELGCGSGIISLFAASKGANVVASDINLIALEALKKASKKNNINLKVIHSNLFEKVESKNFDYIIINPPYYPMTPKNDKERAWFCGENFEYFESLFSQLNISLKQEIIMILSQDCDISKIKSIASKNKLKLKCLIETKVLGEKNYIFKIENR